MKKLLVLVVAVLALAGLATMAYADQYVWKDSWLASYPAIWMGEQQADYGTDSSLHALTYTDLNYGGSQGHVVEYAYDMSKETWTGEVATVNGDASATATIDLSAYSQLKFKVAIPSGGAAVTVEKFTMTDSAGTEHSSGPVVINSPDFSQEITIDLAGTNLITISKLWGVIIKKADNGNTNDTIKFYVDDIRYVGGGRGEVIVRVTGGKRGISIGGSINFGSVTAGVPVRSETLIPAQNFIITNIGDYQNENAVLRMINPAGWTADVTAPLEGANNRYALAAVFNQSAPLSDIYNDSLDFLNVGTTGVRQASHNGDGSGNFEGDASGSYENSGYQIPYNNGTRNLWVKFFPPTTTSTNAEMKIYIEIGF
jgi:hypothetical protein